MDGVKGSQLVIITKQSGFFKRFDVYIVIFTGMSFLACIFTLFFVAGQSQ